MTAIYRGQPVDLLAAVISERLTEAGITAVLSGGSVVTIYAANEYQSADLDFVTFASHARLEPVMRSLGFRSVGRHFEHSDSEYLVEFAPAPVMLGNAHVQAWGELRTASGRLQLLTPTQCVMDRLAAFYHWNDRQCLDQAVMVARRHKVDQSAIERWSITEGHAGKFAEFKAELRAKRPRGRAAAPPRPAAAHR